MRKDRKEIIDEFLKTFEYDKHFETDKFLYWTKDSYFYDGQEMCREEFQCIKDYAVKYGTLPFLILEEKDEQRRKVKSGEGITLGIESNRVRKNSSTNTYSRQRVLRYSKQYENIEFYYYDQDVRATTRNDSGRVVIMSKKRKVFSINDKNYVLINGKRWLSLKNLAGFINKNPITSKLGIMLLNMMLGGDKDWILNLGNIVDNDIMHTSYNISNRSSRFANSLNEAVARECGSPPPKLIMKYFNDNVNNVIKLYNLIEHNKIHYLTNFIKRNYIVLKDLKKGTSYGEVNDLLYYYFLSRDNRCEIHMVSDYIRMLEQEGQKINLNISSYITIKNKHDEISGLILAKNRDKRRLKVSKVYPKIKSTPEIEVELIKSADRLNMESQILHHCVHGYKSSINNGSCAIYSLVYKGERYTLEVNAKRKEIPKEVEDSEESNYKYEFKVNQLKGKYNCNPPTSMKEHFEKMCKKNELILNNGSIRFFDKVKEPEEKEESKVEVEQIGEKILISLLKNKNKTLEYLHLPF